MTSPADLEMPRFRVVLGDLDDIVTATGADLIRWDVTRPKHGWPTSTEAPTLWSSFVAWAALRRLGIVTLKWEEFADTVTAVLPPDDDAEGDTVTVDPTREAPTPD